MREVEAVRRALRTASARLPEVFAPGTRLVVGFSAGQDSTCLLHALAHSHRDLNLLAVHVDHGLRADSAADAHQARTHAEAMGVECRVVRVDVPKGGSIQAAARVARYRALRELAEQHAAKAILVAHTADDQAETVLLNLLRGSGLMGLAGMRMDEPLDGPMRLVRPLQRVRRATTLAYCTHFGLALVEDASNRTRAYTRNRVRLDLLPLLEQFNPAIREVLARTADLAAEDLAVLEALAAELLEQLSHEEPGEYDLAAFRRQPRALQRRVLRLAVRALRGGVVDVSDTPLEDALDLLQTGQPGQAYHLPLGVELGMRKHTFMLQRETHARSLQDGNTWEVAGPRV